MARIVAFIRLLLPSAGMLRVSAYLGCVTLGVALLASRALYADVREAALSAGHEIAGLSDLTRGAEAIRVNGERFHHASLVTQHSLSVVLDRVEAHCRENPNFVGRALAEITDEDLAQIPPLPNAAYRHAVIREESESRGVVACFVDGRPSGIAQLKERIDRFAETLNLSEFGRLRYVYAEKHPAGGTHVVSLWADTGLNLSRMFPSKGDAAGTDSPAVPRPPKSLRTLSADAEGLALALRLYDSSESEGAVRDFYAKTLTTRGFERVELPGGDPTLVYQREDNFQVFITIEEREGRTVVSLTEAGRPEGGNIAAVGLVE